MDPVTPDAFEEWKHHPVTKKLMKTLIEEREEMKEGLVNSSYDDESEIKGRCRVLAALVNLEYEDLFQERTS